MTEQRLLVAGTIAAVLTALLIGWLLATEPRRQFQAAERRLGGDIERGAALYAQHCRTCHGIRGEGIGQLGPPLADDHFFSARLREVGWQSTLREYILTTTEHGRLMGTRPIYAGDGSSAVMPPWHQSYGGPLRSDEIELLTTFVLNYRDTATGKVQLVPLELPEADIGDPRVVEAGQAVFASHCAGCHRYRDLAGPETGTGGPDLSALSGVAHTRDPELDGLEYLRESVLVPGALVVPGYEQAASENPCGAVLTRSELTAVSAFLLQQ